MYPLRITLFAILVTLAVRPVSAQKNESYRNPNLILMVSSDGVGNRIPSEIDSLLFIKHDLSAKDSVLFIFQRDFEELDNLDHFSPELINQITVIKDRSSAIEDYHLESPEGLVIIRFKKEEAFWKFLTLNKL